jgi:hypothetical protein
MDDAAERQLAAIVKGWQLELAERERDGDPYNEGYMAALGRCIQAFKLVAGDPDNPEDNHD